MQRQEMERGEKEGCMLERKKTIIEVFSLNDSQGGFKECAENTHNNPAFDTHLDVVV